jgi:hypothetical protein
MSDVVFPQLDACVVCEDAREEKRRLLTLTGVYGIAPNVEILVRDFAKPITQLAFVLFGGPGQGQFKVSFRLLDPSGNALVTSPEVDAQLLPGKTSTNLVFGLGNVVLPGPGTYTFQLLVNGNDQYRKTFQVSKGQPADFA